MTVLQTDPRDVLRAMENTLSPRVPAPNGRPVLAEIYHRERERLLPVLNAGTNTISSDLKRVLILNETVEALALSVLPLRAFSTVFTNVPLQGTDEVVVPYYPLDATSATSWDAANGYVFDKSTTTSSKKITVNKRKYQPLDYSSSEFRRQPFLDVVRLGRLKADRLGYDVLTDVLSIVTEAKFGAAAFTGTAAEFDSDDVAELRAAANALHWPRLGRSLIVDSTFDAALTKDPSVKLALNIGGTEVIRGGNIPQLSGFDYQWMTGFPTNGENLAGFIATSAAIAVVFAPVEPGDAVRSRLAAYETVTHEPTGITMNYRKWGDPDMDVNKEIIEVAYGYEALIPDALKRICTPPAGDGE